LKKKGKGEKKKTRLLVHNRMARITRGLADLDKGEGRGKKKVREKKRARSFAHPHSPPII